MNVDLSNDARCTAVRTCACSGPITSIRTPGSSTGSVRSRRSGVHGSSALQPSSDSRSWTSAPVGASTYDLPRRQHAALRLGHVRDQLLRQLLVLPSVRRDRQPQQLGPVQQPDGENPPVPAPGPDRRGRRLRAEPPEPAQVARMQLHRRPVVLPLPQHAHGPPSPSTPGVVIGPGGMP